MSVADGHGPSSGRGGVRVVQELAGVEAPERLTRSPRGRPSDLGFASNIHIQTIYTWAEAGLSAHYEYTSILHNLCLGESLVESGKFLAGSEG